MSAVMTIGHIVHLLSKNNIYISSNIVIFISVARAELQKLKKQTDSKLFGFQTTFLSQIVRIVRCEIKIS